jgi:hypothetical protein
MLRREEAHLKMELRKSLFAIALLALTLPCLGQTNAPNNLQYSWAPTSSSSSPGQIGQYLVFNGLAVPRPASYTIDWSDNGTAPSVCTFRVEGSSDGTHWYGLDVTSPTTTSCTTSGMESIAYRPVLFLRINLVAYTQGDSTTAVTFSYTGGRQ